MQRCVVRSVWVFGAVIHSINPVSDRCATGISRNAVGRQGYRHGKERVPRSRNGFAYLGTRTSSTDQPCRFDITRTNLPERDRSERIVQSASIVRPNESSLMPPPVQ